MTSSSSPSSKVEFPFVSDHAPILLNLLPPALHRSTPFKFNHLWMQSEDYVSLVREAWTDPCFMDEVNPQRRIAWKLKFLKSKTKQWFKELKLSQATRLLQLESAIKPFFSSSTSTVLTEEQTVDLAALESKRNDILREQENAWRLRSRAMWLKSGDANTKYFHKLASFNRSKKSIWTIDNNERGPIRGQDALLAEAFSHFNHQFKSPSNQFLTEKATTAALFPHFISDEAAAELFKPVTLTEIKDILLLFKKERSPGPDGWTSEFFIFFFDLVGEDLLLLVEDSRLKGKISRSLNATFLVLIPKKDSPRTFFEYRPISLCNLIYKLISKVISNRIKPFLERNLSAEQLGFLKGRRI